MGVVAKLGLIGLDRQDLMIDRRYVRVDPDTGLIVVIEMGRKWWEAVTAYNTTDKVGRLIMAC